MIYSSFGRIEICGSSRVIAREISDLIIDILRKSKEYGEMKTHYLLLCMISALGVGTTDIKSGDVDRIIPKEELEVYRQIAEEIAKSVMLMGKAIESSRQG